MTVESGQHRRLAIFGSDGFGRETLALVRRQSLELDDIVFVDDAVERHGSLVNGIPVMSFAQAVAEQREVTIAIANASVRRKIAQRVSDAGLSFFNVAASDSLCYENVEIGEGAILCARSMITCNVKIGKQFQLNIYSYVAHDCVIGDYVTFAPNVCCNGRVTIGDGAYIGTGAILRQGTHDRPLTIGAGAVVGMGAVVTKDVPPGTTVVGNPARPHVK